MNITRTYWPPEDMTEDERVDPTVQANTDAEQPGFGVELGWNSPHAKWYQPYLVLRFWRVRVQGGWLYA